MRFRVLFTRTAAKHANGMAKRPRTSTPGGGAASSAGGSLLGTGLASTSASPRSAEIKSVFSVMPSVAMPRAAHRWRRSLMDRALKLSSDSSDMSSACWSSASSSSSSSSSALSSMLSRVSALMASTKSRFSVNPVVGILRLLHISRSEEIDSPLRSSSSISSMSALDFLQGSNSTPQAGPTNRLLRVF